MNIFLLLRLLTFYSLVSTIHVVDSKHQPFIFKPDTLQYYLDWESVTNDKATYAAACPAADEEENYFNLNYSLDRKCLLVGSYENHKTDDFTCLRFFALSAVIHFEPDKEPLIEFGYEISQPPAWGQRAMKGFKKIVRVPPKIPTIKKADSNNPNKIINQELSFIWFSKIVIRYDFKAWNVKSLSYIVTKNPEDLNAECTSNSLGLSFYSKHFVQKYYDKQKIFKNANLSSQKNDICTTEQKCVKKFSLLPPYQFRPYRNMSYISCSDLTTVPIWYKKIEALLNYSEQFLVAVAAATKHEIEVIPGTYGILELLIKGSPKKIYLNSKKEQIPVPRIIFKVVKFQSFAIGSVLEPCSYLMVIVIHNEPDDAPIENICDDKCEVLGWENIQYMTTEKNEKSVKSNHIYCCKLNGELANRIGYVIGKDSTDDLDLFGFPHFDDQKMVRQDRKEMYENKMRELFPI